MRAAPRERRASTTVPRVCRPASPAPSHRSRHAHRPACRLPATCRDHSTGRGAAGPPLRLRSAPRAPTSRASAGPCRLHGRLQHPRRRDRRGAAARAVLRRLHDRVGEHHRDRARGAVGGLLVRRQAGGPQPDTRRPVPDRRARGAPARGRAVRRRPVPRRRGGRARLDLGRRVRRLAARRHRPDRDADPRLRRGRAVRAQARRGRRRRGRHGVRPPLRDLDRRQPARDVGLRAALHPADRHASHVRRLRPRARRYCRDRPCAHGLRGRPARPRRAAGAPGRHGQGGDRCRLARHPRRRHRVPVRPRRRVRGRDPHARAQRGPSRALDQAPRHVPHGRLLGRDARAAVRGARTAAALDRDPRQRRRHDRPRVRALLPGEPASTPSTSTASSPRSGGATSTCERRACTRTPPTPGRSCAARSSATTSSSSTPTASRTSPSTSPRASSSSWRAIDWRPAGSCSSTSAIRSARTASSRS